MDTPIVDFVRSYARSGRERLHMPGHKGRGPLGVEALDITEIPGADSLYEADGIIARSEENASALFGCPTFYSAEGSSQCIRAMVYLATLHARSAGKQCVILAARNVHKTFLSAAALLDTPVRWLYPTAQESYLSCTVTPAALEAALSGGDVTAVYLTSPDYLGGIADIAGISRICRRHGVLLLVDNAHGAYLRFLPRSLHPMDLGADICCDSAHKTLPVITGGAYLHVKSRALALHAKNALALFGSTSPSYLILQSLDAANPALAGSYPRRLADFSEKVEALKEKLASLGWQLYGKEPLKLTLCPKAKGYTGTELADLLRDKNIECEFSDPDYLVLMLTPQVGENGLARLEEALLGIPAKPPIPQAPPAFHRCQSRLSIREAMLSPSRELPVSQCAGRVLASPGVSCPPAVPIAICGDVLDEAALERFRYYGIEHCSVVTE